MANRVIYGVVGVAVLALSASASAMGLFAQPKKPIALPKVEIKAAKDGKCDSGWKFEAPSCPPNARCKMSAKGAGHCVKLPETQSGRRPEVLMPSKGTCPQGYHLHQPTCPAGAMCKMSMPMCRLGKADSYPVRDGKCDAGYTFVRPTCPPFMKCMLRPGVGTCQLAPQETHPGQINEPLKGKCARGFELVKAPCRGGFMCFAAGAFCRPIGSKAGVLGRILEAHQRVVSGVEKMDVRTQQRVLDLYQQARRLVFSGNGGFFPPRVCPMFRCALPRCKTGERLVPQVLAGGCMGCSRCERSGRPVAK